MTCALFNGGTDCMPFTFWPVFVGDADAALCPAPTGTKWTQTKNYGWCYDVNIWNLACHGCAVTNLFVDMPDGHDNLCMEVPRNDANDNDCPILSLACTGPGFNLPCVVGNKQLWMYDNGATCGTFGCAQCGGNSGPTHVVQCRCDP